jgi:uncharacterized protein YrrD
VTADTGEKMGRVEDLLLDSSHHTVVGLLVTDGLLARQRIVPFKELQTVGHDAIIVRSGATAMDAREWLHEGHGAGRTRTLTDKEVVTHDGARIGTVRDVLADDQSGEVVALEVAAPQGRLRRAHHALVHVDHDVSFTNEVVVIPDARITVDLSETASHPPGEE